jgi:hypothetical protein
LFQEYQRVIKEREMKKLLDRTTQIEEEKKVNMEREGEM